MTRDDISDYVGANLVDPLSRVPGVGTVQLSDRRTRCVSGSTRTSSNVWPRRRRHHHGGARPERPGHDRPARRRALGRGAATQRDDQRAGAPADARAVFARSSCAAIPTGRRSSSATSRGSRSAPRPTSSSAATTGSRRAAVAISLATGANALETAAGVERALDALRQYFPTGLEASSRSTRHVRADVDQGVITTLAEAIVLVFLVIYLFLQNFRATLIPTIAVPVVLLGRWACWPRSASRSTCSRCSPWCWRSACWWTTPSSWSRTSSA